MFKYYDKFAKAAIEKLDEYDFTELLSSCYDADIRSAYNIKDEILEDYPELEDSLDNLSINEFIEYMSTKYPVNFFEEIDYVMWYRKNRKETQ